MLRFDEIVFGPVHSRRLGSSLGVNVLPKDGKLCNFDCIYCECGWNRDGRVARPRMASADEVVRALDGRLSELTAAGVRIDSITFSGNGEPTLNPQFPEIVDAVIALRDRHCPHTKTSVLTNATRISDEGVFRALTKVDNPILKIDAATDGDIAVVNRPNAGYSLSETVAAMRRFNGDFILQTMFLAGEGFDSSQPGNMAGWMDIVRTLHPREVMVYSIDRATPAGGLVKFSGERMRELVRPLVEEGFKVTVSE